MKTSSIVNVRISKKSQRKIEDIRLHAKGRMYNAKKFFLLDVSRFFLKKIRENKPKISIGANEWLYAEDLCLGLLEEGGESDTVAIYSHSKNSAIDEQNISSSVLYFNAKRSSPEWVYVLIKHGPWPAFLLPGKVLSSEAIVIARRGRDDEISAIARRILGNRQDIESEFRAAGMIGASIGSNLEAVNMTVMIDLAHDALRGELGFLDSQSLSAWRSAFSETKKYAQECMGKVAAYILNGDKKVFDLPIESDNINKSVIKDGLVFAKEMAKLIR